MANELLRGRQRRYFGYTRDIKHKVDTPDSAKSFRSVLSENACATNKIQYHYEPKKTFRPDPGKSARFADKIIHGAVKTQIPGLLPALNNCSQFEKEEENLLHLRSPDLERQAERSLYYLWLKKPDRQELCSYFHKQLKTKEKARYRQVKQKRQLTGAAAEIYAVEQQEYLESLVADQRFLKQRRVSEIPDRLFRQNRKFQASYWDPVKYKHVSDPFKRTKNKTPALDSICQEHWGTAPEYADLMTCVREYNIKQRDNLELQADDVELSEAKEQARRLSLFGSLEEEEKRRGVKHIKQLKEYDEESESLWKQQAKLMISSSIYINKIKAGRRFPTPPRETQKRRKKIGSSGFIEKAPSSIDVYDYIEKKKIPAPTTEDPLKGLRSRRFPPLPGTPKTGKYAEKMPEIEPEEMVKGVHRHSSHHDHYGKRKHKHYHHNYNSEDFYMEMYLHFMKPDEDVSLKHPPIQLMDVREQRKKMHLDEDPDLDRRLIEMLNADSMEALHVQKTEEKDLKPKEEPPVPVVEGEFEEEEVGEEEGEEEEVVQELKQGKAKSVMDLSTDDIENDREILMHYLQRLNNPRLTHMLTKVISQVSLKPSHVSLSPGSTPEKTPVDHDHELGYDETHHPHGVMDTAPRGSLDELDIIGDVPENELKIIMSEIQESDQSVSSEPVSSGSSHDEEEEEGEGEVEADQELKLFKTVKKKKDSMAEFMDFTKDFRNWVCRNEEGRNPADMNPFAEAVCVLYKEGGERKHNRREQKEQNKTKDMFEKSMANLN